MQAAVTRLPSATRPGRGSKARVSHPLIVADDAGLLEALPIAAAVIERTGDRDLRVTAHNPRFRQTVTQSTCTADDWNEADCLKSGPIAELIHAYFDGVDPSGELDFRDGDGISASFFRVKLAPLPNPEGTTGRCLLSVVDRTVEVQAERALRAEMLRDSLTGLPNRLAFSEAIEKAGEQPGRDPEHAVLVVDMLRFSRINESMGSLAGDELLITFARRLILALRAGDVLARTGGNEFGVLVSLRRGIGDALKAADRIQKVMASPFKISDLEIRVECAIGVALPGFAKRSHRLGLGKRVHHLKTLVEVRLRVLVGRRHRLRECTKAGLVDLDRLGIAVVARTWLLRRDCGRQHETGSRDRQESVNRQTAQHDVRVIIR